VLANIATSLLQPISTLLIVDEATLKMDMITTQTTQYDEEVILLIWEDKELSIMVLLENETFIFLFVKSSQVDINYKHCFVGKLVVWLMIRWERAVVFILCRFTPLSLIR